MTPPPLLPSSSAKNPGGKPIALPEMPIVHTRFIVFWIFNYEYNKIYESTFVATYFKVTCPSSLT